MQTISRYIMTLALLLTAVTGAWAEGTVYNTTVALNDLKAGDVLTDGFKLTTAKGQYIYVKGYKKDGGTAETGDYTQLNAYNSTFPAGVTISESGSTYTPYADGKDANAWIVSDWKDFGSATMLYLDGYNYTAEAPLTVEWNASTKTGTFAMPGSDVVLTPIYAKAAAFATTGTEPEVKTLLPEAAEGVIAGTDASLIAEGTGIVAFAGTSTEVTQGTLMYAIGTSATEAPAPTAFSATVPTAENYDDAATVYVWYYIQGADAPEGVAATLDNTFNDSEICAVPLQVSVLNNKFDIQFNAANANTIEDGKATVKVGDAAKTLDEEGQLKQVKMGSKVTLTAATGYKFRKVEATKGISTLKSVKIGNYTVYYAEGETWYQAFWRDENNNCGLTTSVGRVFTYGNKSLRDSDGDVYADAVINPSKGYYIAD